MSSTALAWRAVTGGAFAHQRGRLALAIGAIALGVGLGFAVALVNASAVEEFGSALRTLAGTADLEIHGPRNGFDETAYARVARDPDVAVASPVVEVDARLEGREEALRIYGIDAFRAAAVTPALIGEGADPLDLLRPGRIFLSPPAARALDVTTDTTIEVQSGLAAVPLVVGGLLPAANAQRFGVMDIAAAQDAFGRAGRISRIDVRVRPGAALAQVSARLAAMLPADVTVATPDANADSALRMSRAYRVNLDVLALVALFTGGLLVFATQTLSIVRRRAQLALLRALGVTRRELTRRLVSEGALVGLAGAVLGLAAGYALAAVVLQAFGGDLGAGYFRGVAPGLAVSAQAAIAFVALGVAVAALGSYLPARAIARAAPASALKAGAGIDTSWRLRSPRLALGLLAAGMACAWLPPVDGLPLFGYVAMALLLAGTLLVLPWIVAIVLAGSRASAVAGTHSAGPPSSVRASAPGAGAAAVRPSPPAAVQLPSPRAVPVTLAIARLRATPGEAGVSLAAIVASVALMVSMAIMVASFRDSLMAWLVQVLPADVYVRAGAAGDSGYLAADAQQRMARVPGVASVAFARTQGVPLVPGAPRVLLLARDLPATDPARVLVLVGEPHAPRAGDAPALWASEAAADATGWRPGARVSIPLGGATHEFTVAGIFRDYARQQGALVIDRAAYVRLTGDHVATEAAITLAQGTAPEDFARALVQALPEAARMTLATPGELRAISLRIFDRTFAVTYALLAVAIVIGLAGLSSAFGASIVARRRELGMLLHLGMTRRQIAGMLVTEGTLMTGIGLVAGIALGGVLAVILVHVVNRQSFHWSMDLTLPVGLLATLAGALLVAAALTSLASARQALRHDAVAAVKDDW